MKLFRNSIGSLVALVDSEDIVDIHNYETSTNTTTLTIPAVNNKDINFVNYGAVAWTLAPDTNEGLTINKSTSSITVNAGKSVSLRYDSLAKNFIIAGRSEASGGGGSTNAEDIILPVDWVANPSGGAVTFSENVSSAIEKLQGQNDNLSTNKVAKAGDNMSGALNEAKSTDIASGATTDLATSTGNYVIITGTTTITSLGTLPAGSRRILEFSGILTLTHNATSLVLPTSANIITTVGDKATFVSMGGGNWKCVSYMRADGTALAGGGGGSFNPNTDTVGATITPNNTPIIANMSVNDAFEAAQGQITAREIKSVDESMGTTGTINLDFNNNSFDSITQTGSITFTASNTTGSKKIVKTIVVQGSGNAAHTFTIPVGWVNLSGVLPDYSKLNYMEISYVDGTVFFCVNKYSLSTVGTPPTLVRVSILQDFLNTIEIQYSALLDSSVTPLTAWYSVTGKTISSISILNNTVRLVVSVPFAITDTTTMAFTNPASGNGIQGALGDKVADFAGQAVAVIIYRADTFVRADNASSANSPSDGGSNYVPLAGTWGIISNKLYCASAVNSGVNTPLMVSLDTGVPDFSVKYNITWPASAAVSSAGIAVRVTDNSNYYVVQFGRNSADMVQASVYKVVAGVITQLGSTLNVGTFADGTNQDYIVRCRGNQLSMIYNGTVYQAIVDNTFLTQTKMAFRVFDGAGTAGNLDRFTNLTVSV